MISAADAAARRTRGAALARRPAEGSGSALDVRVLPSFNLDLFAPYLVEALDRYGVEAVVDVRPFAQVAQEVVDSESALYRGSPDVVAIVVSGDDAAGAEAAKLEEIGMLVGTLGERLPRATVVLVPMGASRLAGEHVLAAGASERGRIAAADFVARVAALAAPNVLVADWEWRVRRVGSDMLEDVRLWYLARMRLGPVGLAHLAEVVAEIVAAARGAARKVCAVDLDGLLWGGTVGEDGMAGILLGEDGVGLAFQDFQRVLLGLRETGVLLTVCSRNDPGAVDELFARHAGMLLGRGDFSAERINWEDKATNLAALAEELGLGLDSFVFLDDDPVQREWVRAAQPDVLVPELPSDPAERPDFLRRAPFFQRISITAADAGRADDYSARRTRAALKEQAPSVDEFIAGLEQRVTIEPVRDGSLGRAVQLAQRTNQFNLDPRRYTTAELQALLADPSAEAYTLALSDRFGDSGITGLAILRVGKGEAEVETFLLSCRVLGRRVEDAFLAYLAERARTRGARRLIGRYTPTGRNEVAREFYAHHGFSDLGEGLFALALDDRQVLPPPGIEVEAARA
jgi:FkbH-like protein